MEPADVARLPDPADAGSWRTFTHSLRALHLSCGRPTYEALSARTGLPKSAISYLIGRNPVRQPSTSTVQRFVEGCLGYAGCAAATIENETNRWRQAHQRLAEADPSADSEVASPDVAPPGLVPPEPSPRPGGGSGPTRHGRTLLAIAAATCLAAGATVAVAGVARSQDGAGPTAGQVPSGGLSGGEAGTGTTSTVPAPAPSPSATDAAAAGHTGPQCVERAEPQTDARLGRDWPTVFYCPNRPSHVYTWARDDGRPISDLGSRNSWFVCWTDGRTRAGAPEVFYYTQGDTTSRRPELDAWGYVPATAVTGTPAPAAGLTRRCPFPTSPTDG